MFKLKGQPIVTGQNWPTGAKVWTGISTFVGLSASALAVYQFFYPSTQTITVELPTAKGSEILVSFDYEPSSSSQILSVKLVACGEGASSDLTVDAWSVSGKSVGTKIFAQTIPFLASDCLAKSYENFLPYGVDLRAINSCLEYRYGSDRYLVFDQWTVNTRSKKNVESYQRKSVTKRIKAKPDETCERQIAL